MADAHEVFERIVGGLDDTVFVVTTVAGDERAGCLVGFATQASIDPSRFLVGLSVANRTFRVACGARHLAVHVLGSESAALARLFGGETGDEVDKFARCAWHVGPHGLPVLDEAVAWFGGRILDRTPFGDHTGFLLEPEDGECDRPPVSVLTRSALSGLQAGHDA